MTTTTTPTTTIEADPKVPVIRTAREFAATVDQVQRAHTDPELYVQWVGLDSSKITIVHWDARTGGSWRFTDRGDGFHGSFHDVSPGRIVQTFTWDPMPEAVFLETMTMTDLGDGRTLLECESLINSFEARDGMLASGMDTGVIEGYAKLDALLSRS